MAFLRWLGGLIILFWLIGIIFKIGGILINFLLLIGAFIFIIDSLLTKRKTI
ncbi:hypothetical protein CLOACE_02650 [Clostridium acetireducens DSM 10703]|uniref:Lmo0937 family membrane protein n=1 Tax=Clostridium acetireducens DSM 10703 TaxID=1121290 RepID=A0A1E8F251_9CLOT|nr:hypothetical protein [Clostridium acetireducens]OFI07436.1 hypothetical protein CLOACE_02650 [Clostridium acetireducens DSM 10703]